MDYIYKIGPDDLVYADEFRKKPIGHHSPGLQRVLSLFRGAEVTDRYVIFCTKPHREWMLAQVKGCPYRKFHPLNIRRGRPNRVTLSPILETLKTVLDTLLLSFGEQGRSEEIVDASRKSVATGPFVWMAYLRFLFQGRSRPSAAWHRNLFVPAKAPSTCAPN